MIIFSFNINKKIDKFSISLADEFMKYYPPDIGESSKKVVKIEKKLTQAIRHVNIKIENYKKENKLNIYRKARIGNTFMWSLRENGYDDEFSEDITKELLYKLN